MIPIVTPEEMGAADAAAPEPVEVLIGRAGSAVARAAVRMLGGTYGRRVVVVAGKGNNGNDGRSAAEILRRRGVSVTVLDAGDVPGVLAPCDLVIDAAYGTGFSRSWIAPDPGDALVLAVDIPSGIDGLTGQAGVGVMEADATVVLAALKPGLLFAPGSALAGDIELADIGLPCSSRTHLVQRLDIDSWWNPRVTDAHKWQSSTRVVAGSPGMTGSAHLAASAAQRASAGMVHLSVPGGLASGQHEYVQRSVPEAGWSSGVLAGLDRFQSLVIGPGLGRSDDTISAIRDVVRQSPLPTVIDGDGLFALGWSPDGIGAILRDRRSPTVLTPHDGEYAVLAGCKPDHDRIGAARLLAHKLGVVVLLKGPATVVADPGGEALVVTAGDARLATAGTGDVLSGIIGALLAQGLSGLHAAAAGAWIHGHAARLGHARGLIASDLLPLIPCVLDSLS